MSFGIGRGVAEVQILKNSETGPEYVFVYQFYAGQK